MTERQAHRITLALFGLLFLAGLAIGIPVGVSVTQLDETDVADPVASGVTACVGAIKQTFALLDDEDSRGAYTPAEIVELRQLPPRCQEDKVREALEAAYPDLLDKVQTIGT